MHEHEQTPIVGQDKDETAQFPEHLIRPVEHLDSEKAQKEREAIIRAIDAAEKEAGEETMGDKTPAE